MIYCMPKIRKREGCKLNIWDFMFLFFPCRKNFRHYYFVLIPQTSFFPSSKTKPVFLIKEDGWGGGGGGEEEALEPNFHPDKLFNDKQNGNWREVSVESFFSFFDRTTPLEHGVRLLNWRWENELGI